MPSKKYWKKPLYILIGVIAFLLVIDYVILPLYVSGKEHQIPNVLGKNKDEAIRILQDAGFTPIVQTSRYDQKYQKDQVIFQKPSPGSMAKENRRIYLSISGGEPMVKVPALISRTIRDAKMNLERIGLTLGKIDSVESELPVNSIVEQQYSGGTEIAKGKSVSIKVSIGPQVGKIRVPNLFGKPLAEVESILKDNSLKLGIKTYIHSQNYLPNTVVDQFPSVNSLVNIGDSISVTLTKMKPD